MHGPGRGRPGARAHSRPARAGRRLATSAALLVAALAALALAPGASAATPAEFWTSTVGKTTPGAQGVAVAPEGAPNEGHVFVADQVGGRIVELTAWGVLVKIWGWDVVSSGPEDTASGHLETCVPAKGDECKAGTRGKAGVGQLNIPQGVAVDSAGEVYVYDNSAHRVQKFDPNAGEGEGEVGFLWMIGGGVDQGGGAPPNPGNLCTAAYIANGDICGEGSTGPGDGKFGAVSLLGGMIAVDSGEAVYPEDALYVGDVGRIQRFDTAGSFKGEVKLPGETISTLTVDSEGYLYAAYRSSGAESKPDVHELDPTIEEPSAPLLSFAVDNPKAIAVAANGDVYALDIGTHISSTAEIRRFDASGDEIESFGEELNGSSTGLATSSACGIEGTDLFYSDPAQGPIGEQVSLLRAYAVPAHAYPDPELCPQPQLAPEIESQYAASVGTDSASVEARINPHFWTDASYYLEYGTADCSSAPCKKLLLPGAPLSAEVLNEGVAADAEIEGLEAGRTYHFRFLAQSGGGGPSVGADRTFTTYRPPETQTGCPNQALRGGSAALPDCRAYEMVSPVDKNGGDADAFFYEGLRSSPRFDGLDVSTPGGEKLAYTATSSFAGAVGGAAYPEYIAKRGAGGWESESIDPPMRGGSANEVGFISSQFKVFSEDLCQAWLVGEASEPLTPGPAFGYRNLYRREGCSAPPGYAWLESSAPEPHPAGYPFLFPDLQGVTPDGRCAVFRVNEKLTAEAPEVEDQDRFTSGAKGRRCDW